ncbi:MAG TPA: flagellar filament capping protein FliD [Bacteroidota bacterium]|nr:flagellar filament capping protein FliD [Bacteroidota bacterium]
MADVSSVSSSSSGLDSLVANYEATLQGPVVSLQNQVSDLNAKVTALSSLKTKLSTLSTTINSMAHQGTLSPFLTYAVASSSATVATATATSYAQEATHSLKVSQLASNDMLLSSSIDGTADSGLSANTAYSFSIQVGTSDVRQVNVNLASTSNKDVLTTIAQAINADTVLASKISASVVNVDGVHSRLVISADNSGASSAITSFSGDFQSFLGLNAVDFTARTASSSAGAGFAKSGAAADALNAKFSLDGIDMVRESNTVKDALQGVTLALTGQQASSDSPVTLTVAADNSAIKTQITQFITNYNAVISYLNTNTSTTVKTDSSTGTQTTNRGTLIDDPSARTLRTTLRQMVGGAVTGLDSGKAKLLSTLGITIGTDGTLTLSDSSKLDDLVDTDVTQISNLFSNSAGNGIAQQLKSQIDRYTSLGGSIEMTTSTYNSQIKSMNDRITSMNEDISKKGDAFRTQYAQLEVLLEQIQSQQTMLSYFASTSS